MRILICGGRDFANPIPYDHSEANKPKMDQYRYLHKKLDEIICPLSKSFKNGTDEDWLLNDITIIAGKAKGVDTAAINWAICNWVLFEEYPADWKKYPKAAGPIRNQQMIDEGKPDLGIAFPGGKGTKDMVSRLRKAKIPVMEITYEGE